jgi:ABC-type multidrug transport system fused ATPase/permease subunit
LRSRTRARARESALLPFLLFVLVRVVSLVARSIAGAIIALIASWRLALILFCAYPLLVVGGYFEFSSFAGVFKAGSNELEKASTALSESVTAARVVAAFGLQPRTQAMYAHALEGPRRAGVRGAFVTAAGQSFQRFMLQCTYALAFYAGGRLIGAGLLDFGGLIKCFLSVTLSAEAMGRITSQSADTAKANTAAAAIFALIDAGESSAIDPFSPAGASKGAGAGAGGVRIEFRNVHFSYPTRRDAPVLVDFNLTIEPGQCVGVVGQSGSGKSTLALLVGRAYDVDAGAVLVDGLDVRQWNVSALRAALGLVFQEPALFADSIAYNIGYGVGSADKPQYDAGVQPKETGDASAEGGGAGKASGEAPSAAAAAAAAEKDAVAVKVVETAGPAKVRDGAAASYAPPTDDVVRAAAAANAVSFISEFPFTYATYCGARGNQLSGGQKQRVAIARALLRSPRCLLLDEATAALDSKSEEVVQAALDRVIAEAREARASAGAAAAPPRTTLVIAHRLSTLANSDRIVVIEKGAVVEDGTHAALMAREDGKYRALALAQQGGGAH